MCKVCKEISDRNITSNVMRRRIRRSKTRGRPRGSVQNQEQKFSIFVKFMYLFGRQGNVAIRTILRGIPRIRENIQPVNVSQLFYMISQRSKAKYVFENNQLRDVTEYQQITQSLPVNGTQNQQFEIQLPLQKIQVQRTEVEQNRNEFLVYINKILRELDDNFIDEFIKILEFYLRNKGDIQLVEQLYTLVQNGNQFPHLQQWRMNKDSTYQTQIEIERAELLERYNNQNLRRSAGVVQERLQRFVNQILGQLDEESNSDPLKFFLQKLVNIFDEGSSAQQIYEDTDGFFNLFDIY